MLLTSVLQIGIYSSVYWNNQDNQDKWLTLFNSTPPTPPQASFWGDVGKSDVAGAAAGVAAFGVGALLGGPVTWGAFGISVGGWAAGCSVYTAVMSFLG